MAQIRMLSTNVTPNAGSAGIQAGVTVAPTTGGRVAFYSFGVSNGVTGALVNAAIIQGNVTENWIAGANQGMDLQFGTTAIGSTARTIRWVMDGAGNLGSVGVTFANLGTPADGKVVYCSDAKDVAHDLVVAGSVAVSGGGGAWVHRQQELGGFSTREDTMKVKTSWTRLIQAAQIGRQYLAVHPEKTRLEYAIQRMLPRFAKTNDDLQEQLEGIDIDHAATNAEGVLLVGPQGYQFTPVAKKKCVAARRALLNKEDGVEVEAYFATTVPDDIDEVYLDAFEGLLIRTEDAERIRASREVESSEDQSSSQPTVQ